METVKRSVLPGIKGEGGMNRWSTEDFQQSENTVYGTILIDTCYYTLQGEEKGAENIFEDVIAENVPNLGKETVNQVQEVQRAPYRINPRRNMPRHISIKLSKIKHKEKISKPATEKQQVTYKGIPIS